MWQLRWQLTRQCRCWAGFGQELLRKGWLGGCLMLVAGTSPAHLLNMSRAELTLHPPSTITDAPAAELRLELDLTRALGSSTAFHAASLVRDPLANRALAELTRSAAMAVDLSINGTPVRWQAESLVFAQRTLADYQSAAIWPRATLRLRGFTKAAADDAAGPSIRLRFQPDFPFEEPIAVTVRGAASTPSMTRWLVAEQWFPALSATLATSLGAPATDDRNTRSATPEAAEAIRATLITFIGVGLRHVLPGGWDHLAFVVGLLLLAATRRGLFRLLLWYTAAHTTAYLALALRLVPVPGPWVEWLILLSIIWAGTSVLRRTATTTTSSPNGLVVFGFGLIHGLGFASSLDSLPLSLGGRLAAILGFNLGVDVAQLGAALIIGWLLAREIKGRPLRHYAASPLALILILGPIYYLLKILIFS